MGKSFSFKTIQSLSDQLLLIIISFLLYSGTLCEEGKSNPEVCKI